MGEANKTMNFRKINTDLDKENSMAVYNLENRVGQGLLSQYVKARNAS